MREHPVSVGATTVVRRNYISERRSWSSLSPLHNSSVFDSRQILRELLTST